MSDHIVVRMKQGHHPSGHLYGLIVNGTIAFAWIERVGGKEWRVAIGPEEEGQLDLIRTTSSEQTPRAVAEEAAETFHKAMRGEGVESPRRDVPETALQGDQPQGNPIFEEQYRKLAHLLGLECARFDLTKHPDPFSVEVDVAPILPDPYEVVSWRFGLGATHTAGATGAWRFPGDGRTLLVFEVRPLTAYLEEVTP